jgi:hypothetical protein
MTTAAGLRLTPLQQDLEMETLQLLEAYMEEEGLFEGAPVVEENNQETGAGAPTVVDQIQQYLGGDDSIQSREDALANPQ